MSGTVTVRTRPAQSRSARRLGYAVSVAVNVVMFWVVSNAVEWRWPPFLTAEFARVDHLMLVSIGAAILANVTYLSYDRRPFRSFAEMGLNALSFWVTLRVFQVFPFDFSGYSFDWTPLVKVVLVLAMVGTAIGFLTELVRAVRSYVRR